MLEWRMAELPKKISSLLDDLGRTTDPEIRHDLLIEYASRFQEVSAKIAVRPFPEQNRVPGCESEAYVWAVQDPESKIKFYFAVENPQGISAKALATILDETLSGESAESVQMIDESIVDQIFGKTVSMGKGLGLMNMVRTVKSLAAGIPAKIAG